MVQTVHLLLAVLLLLFPLPPVLAHDQFRGKDAAAAVPKNLVLDTDLDVEDVLAILYILKQNRSLINLKASLSAHGFLASCLAYHIDIILATCNAFDKEGGSSAALQAITLDSNAWVNPGFGVNMVYDLLFTMGRDDIAIGVGGEGGITQDGTIQPNVGGYVPIIDQMLYTCGSCRYRQAIPPGRGAGSLDVDTHYGLRSQFLPQGERHYIPGKQRSSQEVLLEALSTGSNTVLLTGSHTNFALLLMTHPEVKKNIQHVYIMGGGESGNLFTGTESNPRAEFNIFADPFASYQVFHSGLAITLVPLEATDTVPVTQELITALERSMNSLEANYTYHMLSMLKHIWPDAFSQYFYLWDSFTSAIAISGMLNGHDASKNEFGTIDPALVTIVTSNEPYGVRDGSNPLFETKRWRKFGLEKGDVHSGHVQTGLRDPFCYVPRGEGICKDGRTVITKNCKSGGGVLVQVVGRAKLSYENNEKTHTSKVLDKEFYSSFINALNSPHQSARFTFQRQTPSIRENQYRVNSSGPKRLGKGKALLFDMDMSPGDILTLVYLLKVPRTIVELKAITVSGNGFANAASIDTVYDVLDMMGRDDVSVGMGALFARGQAYSNATGDCKYRRAVPQGTSGLLDSDTLYGLARSLPRSPRRYSGRSQLQTSTEVITDALRGLGGSAKLTVVAGGPVTNLAEFLTATRNQALKDLIEEVYVLGGSISRPGNVFTVEENSKAEFNMFLDPLAAEIVLCSGLRVTLLPLDVTEKVSPEKAFLNHLRSRHRHRTPESCLVHKLLRTVHELKTKNPAYVHAANPLGEVVAAAVAVNSTALGVVSKEVAITVEATGDVSRDGWTRVDEHGCTVRIVEKINRTALDFQVASALTAPA
ncbi:uncharacterized protein LOC112344613 [Selaginella moellendorffii]|uniref:uncharacterized protein LOC112344613 n=1 Tax=Selaginella moellendorffii TaxID=88036 RepID=UPI000D1D001F|nr:uncharacterized protein LOC112344613 [Selaginella moellendorffii]|eukprot:XP_024525453.1 uncharacterized protein LOC112344613 [Selaginella moellendorffii]